MVGERMEYERRIKELEARAEAAERGRDEAIKQRDSVSKGASVAWGRLTAAREHIKGKLTRDWDELERILDGEGE